MVRRALAVAFSLATAGLAHAQGGGIDIVERKDIPAAVAREVLCGSEPDSITRRPFAGGVVFVWDCPGNHANAIQALVFANAADGAGARLLRFPPSRRKNNQDEEPALELSNLRWFPGTRELLSIFVDREGGGFCRFESRWRLTGRPPEPVLVTSRKTRDCEGRRGWVTIVGRR